MGDLRAPPRTGEVPFPTNVDAHASGSSAEWIVERETLTDGTLATLENYSAIFFFDSLEGGSNYEINLSVASLVNMTNGSTTLSTALEVSSRAYAF